MASRNLLQPLCALLGVVCATSVLARDDDNSRANVSFSTVSITPYAIEGLVGDNNSSVYTTGRAPVGTPCPVWQISTTGTPPVTPVQVGSIPNPAGSTGCSPSGIAFDRSGNIYVADGAQGGVIWR